jgi:gas vesicle protein
MAEDVSTTVRSIVEKVLEADVKDQIAQRGREVAKAVSEATDAVSQRAGEAWQDSEASRREAARTVRQASQDAAKWTQRTWKRDIRPSLRDLWSRRTIALGAAGAAVPAGRELIEDAAVRMGIRQRREERHWMAFFFGLLVGALAGAAVALLTAPKPGRETRDELADAAREAAGRAREAAGGASDWVPLFQRPEGNGDGPLAADAAEPIEAPDEMASEVADTVEQAADDAADTME